MSPIDFEFGFKTLWGLATAAGWFWVNGISGRLKEAEKDRADLRQKLHDVELEYATKEEAKSDRADIYRLLHRIEDKLDKLTQIKVDK